MNIVLFVNVVVESGGEGVGGGGGGGEQKNQNAEHSKSTVGT